jgi:hypothetical protein
MIGIYTLVRICRADLVFFSSDSPSFSLFTSPSGDDILHDEALESRIAALNLLDLDLAHLGVIVDEGDDIAEIDEAVKNAGHQLQRLESSHAARDKMEHLLRTHTVIAGM